MSLAERKGLASGGITTFQRSEGNKEQLGGCPHITGEVCQGHAENKEAGMQDSESFFTICRGKTGVESKGSLEGELTRQSKEC